LEKVFGRWQPRPIDFPPEVKVKPQAKPGIYVIDRADLTQTNIYIGHFGIRKDNPDRYALALMNYILGGGSFNSRMTSIIRSDMGLAYSVGSTFELNSRDIGLFYADCQTKTETTYKAVFNIIDQIKKITAGEVTPEEFAFARDSYINRFVFTFTDPAGIVSSLMNLEYDGMPRNFYKDYIANIEKVTIPDILTAAKTYLRPDSLSIFLVGNRAGFEAEISQLGKITEIELLPPQID